MLSFTDVEGESGIITEDFDVEYSGTWQDEIEEFVNDFDAEPEPDDATEHGLLIAELPDEAPIVEIERVNGEDIDE